MKAANSEQFISDTMSSLDDSVPVVSPVYVTIDKIGQEITKMSQYIAKLEQKALLQSKEIHSLKDKLTEKEAISRGLEDENVKLKKELCEIRQALHQNDPIPQFVFAMQKMDRLLYEKDLKLNRMEQEIAKFENIGFSLNFEVQHFSLS